MRVFATGFSVVVLGIAITGVAKPVDRKDSAAQPAESKPAAQAPLKKAGTELAAWPPKKGIKTPGVQIQMTKLKPDAEIALTGPAGGMVAGGLVAGEPTYVALGGSGGVMSIAAKTNTSELLIAGIPPACAGAVTAFGAIWVPSCTDGKLSRVDTKEKKLAATISVAVADVKAGIAASADSLWLLSDDKTTLSRIDPEEKKVAAEIRLPASCNSVLFADGALWVTCPKEDKVLRIHPQTNLVDNRIEAVGEPTALAFGGGSLWVLCARDGKVLRIDPKTNKVATTVELNTPSAGGSIAFGEGAVWVSGPDFPITRIDPATDKVAQQFAGGGSGSIYTGAGSVWLADSKANTLKRFDPKRIKATLAE